MTHAGKGGLCFILLQRKKVSKLVTKDFLEWFQAIKTKQILDPKVIRDKSGQISKGNFFLCILIKLVVRSRFDLKIAAVYLQNCKCRLSNCWEPNVFSGEISVVYMV